MPDNHRQPAIAQRLLQLLIIEDSPADAELMVAMLKRVGYALSFDVVDSPEQFQQQFSRSDYDLILSDYNLRTWTAMDALCVVKKSGKDIPFVVVTGALGDEAAVECIKQGAADYLLKHRLQRLPVVVDRALRDKAQREEAGLLHEQIALAKREWELTFDTVPDPILVIDEHHRIYRANRAAAEAFGFEFTQLIGKLCYQVVHGQNEPPTVCPHQRLLETGDAAGGDLGIPWLGKTFLCTATPVRDPSGRVRGCVHVLRDVTQRKQAEERLAEQLEELRRWHQVTLNREERVLNLKQEVNELLGQAGKPPRYLSVESDDLVENRG